jgi:hypothetical protein
MFVRSRPSRTLRTHTVAGARLGRPYDGHQASSGSNQACGPLPDVTADGIE